MDKRSLRVLGVQLVHEPASLSPCGLVRRNLFRGDCHRVLINLASPGIALLHQESLGHGCCLPVVAGDHLGPDDLEHARGIGGCPKLKRRITTKLLTLGLLVQSGLVLRQSTR